MKFKTRKFDLQNELTFLSSVVDKKSKDEIYQCVHLVQKDNLNLTLSASSRELMLTTAIKIDGGASLIPSETPTNGNHACAIDATKLFELCKKLPDKLIDLDYDATTLKVVLRCDNSRFTISCLEPSLFPSIKLPRANPNDFSYKLPLRFFFTAINSSLNLVSLKEGAQVFYSGILMILEDKVLEIIATDGNRMSIWFTTMETDKNFKLILPKRTLVELASSLANNQQPAVNLEITSSHAFLNFGKYTYQSGILIGTFPNYKLVIDAARQNNDLCFRMNRQKLNQALERCLVFVGKDQGFGINFDFKEHELALSAANMRGDYAYEIVEAECPKPYKIRLNGEWLRQYLETVPNDDSVDLYVNSQEVLKPVYLRSQNERNYIFLISPMETI